MLTLVDRGNRIHWLMLEEFDAAEKSGTLYLSELLTEDGRDSYPSLFRDAVLHFEEEWLADQLLRPGWVATAESPAELNGRVAEAVSPQTIKALAKGEINRFYCIAVCRAAIEDQVPEVLIYQAEEIPGLAPECTNPVGQSINAKGLLDSLRKTSLDGVLRLPPDCRQSILSVRLPPR